MTRSVLGSTGQSHARLLATGLVSCVAALALVCALPAAASATPGQIDPTFGPLGNGSVFVDRGPGEYIHKVLIQPDGKIVTVASVRNGTVNPGIAVTRYLTNGSPDPSFGTGGVFSSPAIDAGTVTDAALQPDGKIVVVGWTSTFVGPTDTSEHSFFVRRLLANGTIDPSFVTAHPTTNFPGTSLDEAYGIAL